MQCVAYVRFMRHLVFHLFGVPDSSTRPELDVAEMAVAGLGGTGGLEPRANFIDGSFIPLSSPPSLVIVSSAVTVLLHFPSDIDAIGFVLLTAFVGFKLVEDGD